MSNINGIDALESKLKMIGKKIEDRNEFALVYDGNKNDYVLALLDENNKVVNIDADMGYYISKHFVVIADADDTSKRHIFIKGTAKSVISDKPKCDAIHSPERNPSSSENSKDSKLMIINYLSEKVVRIVNYKGAIVDIRVSCKMPLNLYKLSDTMYAIVDKQEKSKHYMDTFTTNLVTVTVNLDYVHISAPDKVDDIRMNTTFSSLTESRW